MKSNLRIATSLLGEGTSLDFCSLKKEQLNNIKLEGKGGSDEISALVFH